MNVIREVHLLGTDGRDIEIAPSYEVWVSGITIMAPIQQGVYLIRLITDDKSARVFKLVVI
jgi:hypothetical protein